MTLPALALVLISAVAHAAWNLLAKRAGGGAAFLWLFDAVALAAYAPVAALLVVLSGARIGRLGIVFMAGSAVLHLGYFLLLQRGYRVGDLSLVYPLARGTGPMLATAAAIVLFGERPSPAALAGGLLVVGGVVALTGDLRKLREGGSPVAVVYAIITGAFIAAYTLWDKEAVSGLLLHPVLYNWGTTLGRLTLLAPWIVGDRDEVVPTWRAHRAKAIGVGLLSPLAYILVLTALAFTPVSYVAPAREVGILLGVVMGTRWLAEPDATRRWAAAALMVVGIALLASMPVT